MTIDAVGNIHDNTTGQFTGRARRDGTGSLPPIHTLQTATPIERESLHASNRRAREVARYIEDGGLILDPPYQRPSVWKLPQRQALVRSWLGGLPVPAVVLNDRKATYAVVDGKQRIETAIMWFAGEFSVPASWFKPEYINETVDTDDGEYVTYIGLTEEGRRSMHSDAMLPVIETKLATVEEEAELYDRLNTSGTEQTAEDIENARRVAAGR